MVTPDYYRRTDGLYNTLTDSSSGTIVSSTRYRAGTVSSDYVKQRSKLEKDNDELKRQNSNLKNELHRSQALGESLARQNTGLHKNINSLTAQMSILYDAVSIFVSIDKVKEVVKKITAAHKNKYEFNKLMGQESAYLLKDSSNSK